jgi:hypothetical protein
LRNWRVSKQNSLEQEAYGDEQAVAEKEIPVGAHRTYDVEGVRFHGFDDGHFLRSVFGCAEDAADGMEGAVDDGEHRSDAQQDGRFHATIS